MKSLALLTVLSVLVCFASAGFLGGWSGGYRSYGHGHGYGGHGYGGHGHYAPVVVRRVVYSSPSHGWHGYSGGSRSYGGYSGGYGGGYGGWNSGWW